MELRPLSTADQGAIGAWPPYPEEFRLLDYALRPGGWLDQYPPSASAHRYAAWRGDVLVGFSMLVDHVGDEAEFYIAIHPDHLGEGAGRSIMRLTLAEGFQRLGLQRIRLRVRTWHRLGIGLYAAFGFVPGQVSTEPANGLPTEFLHMVLERTGWKP